MVNRWGVGKGGVKNRIRIIIPICAEAALIPTRRSDSTARRNRGPQTVTMVCMSRSNIGTLESKWGRAGATRFESKETSTLAFAKKIKLHGYCSCSVTHRGSLVAARALRYERLPRLAPLAAMPYSAMGGRSSLSACLSTDPERSESMHICKGRQTTTINAIKTSNQGPGDMTMKGSTPCTVHERART